MLRGLRAPQDIPAKATKAPPPPTQTLEPLVQPGLKPRRPAPGQRGFDKAVGGASETLQVQARGLKAAQGRAQERLEPLGANPGRQSPLKALGGGGDKVEAARSSTPAKNAELGQRLRSFGRNLSQPGPQVLKAFGESGKRSVNAGERLPGLGQTGSIDRASVPGLDEIRARLASPDAARASMPDFVPGPSARLLGPRTDLLVAGLVPTPSNFEAAKPEGLNAKRPIAGPARGPSTQTVPFRPSSGVFVVGKAETPADVAKESFGRVSV